MSTIIKAGEAGAVLRRLSTVDLADYLDEARQLVRDAKREAASILSAARREGERLQAEAHRAGRAEGQAQGEQEGRKLGYEAAHAEATTRFEREQADLVKDFTSVIEELDGVQAELRETAEREVLELAMRIARKLTFSIGRLHHEAAMENLERALALVSENERLHIRVHPDDLETMRTYAESSVARVGSSRTVAFEPDESMSPGGCRVTGHKTDIDATLETQLDELVSLLTGGTRGDG